MAFRHALLRWARLRRAPAEEITAVGAEFGAEALLARRTELPYEGAARTSAAASAAEPAERVAREEANITLLFLGPTGLADGLALKELRYAGLPAIRPMSLAALMGSPLSVLPGDSAAFDFRAAAYCTRLLDRPAAVRRRWTDPAALTIIATRVARGERRRLTTSRGID